MDRRIRCRIDLHVVVFCSLHLLIWMAHSTSGQVMCVKQLNSCQCQTKSGKYIDLGPLDDFRFNQIPGPLGSWVYSYNPCFGFKCQGTDNVAMCQNAASGDPSLEFALGTQDKAVFGYDLKNGLNMQYSNTLSGVTRISLMKLICSPIDADEFKPLDDGILSDSNTYTYSSSLTTKHACEVDSPTVLTGGGGGGMSPGDVMLIVVFVILFGYLAVGFALNVFVRKTPLGPGALPNANFWLAVFGHIRDGAVFCWDRLRQLFTQRATGYEGVK